MIRGIARTPIKDATRKHIVLGASETVNIAGFV
jgi:hypothetical protein